MSNDRITLSRRAIVIGVVAVFAAGLASKSLFWRDAPKSAVASRMPALTASPHVDALGAPVGFAQSKEGARDAAVAFVQLGNRILSVDTATATALLQRIASLGSADQFAQQELAGFAQLRNALSRGSGPIAFHVGVVATRVDAYAPTRARVELWRVAVLSRDGMTDVGEQWATVTYDLVWEEGDWKIWAETDAPGPDPAPSASQFATPAELDATLSGFVPVGTP